MHFILANARKSVNPSGFLCEKQSFDINIEGRIRLHLIPQGANYGVAAIELAASNSPPDYCI